MRKKQVVDSDMSAGNFLDGSTNPQGYTDGDKTHQGGDYIGTESTQSMSIRHSSPVTGQPGTGQPVTGQIFMGQPGSGQPGTGHLIPSTMHWSSVTDQSEVIWPASVTQLDARPTGDQEVVGSTPLRSATRLIMKYFLRSFSPFR